MCVPLNSESMGESRHDNNKETKLQPNFPNPRTARSSTSSCVEWCSTHLSEGLDWRATTEAMLGCTQVTPELEDSLVTGFS